MLFPFASDWSEEANANGTQMKENQITLSFDVYDGANEQMKRRYVCFQYNNLFPWMSNVHWKKFKKAFDSRMIKTNKNKT